MIFAKYYSTPMANPWYRLPRRRCSIHYCCKVARTSHPLYICDECKKLEHKPNTASCLHHVYACLFICKHFNNRIVYKDFTNFARENISVASYTYPREYFNYYPTIELSKRAYLQPIHKNYVFSYLYTRQGEPINYIYKGVGSYGSFQEYNICPKHVRGQNILC